MGCFVYLHIYFKVYLISMGIEKQGAKPTGKTGTFIGRLMNKFHTRLYVKYFSENRPPKNSKILDIGCGGGKFLNYLANLDETYILNGLDHSEEMIELSKKVNHQLIQDNRLKLYQGSVSEIPLQDAIVSLATAFETIMFWPDIEKSFSEVFRVLDDTGTFIIINRYPPEGSKWWKLATLKSESDYKQQLQLAGFTNVNTDLTFKRGWIVVVGKK
jgi:ubiquinone/menaquinone biosynthesis C-methylase UbiE